MQVVVGAGLFWFLVVALLVLAVWLLVVTLSLGRFLKYRKSVARAAREGNLSEVISSCLREIDRLDGQIAKLKDEDAILMSRLASVIQKVGVVRYDAFDDIGGELSYSVALLNERGDGVVVTSINGRHESRTYAKPIETGHSPHNLSREEKEAIARALA